MENTYKPFKDASFIIALIVSTLLFVLEYLVWPLFGNLVLIESVLFGGAWLSVIYLMKGKKGSFLIGFLLGSLLVFVVMVGDAMYVETQTRA